METMRTYAIRMRSLAVFRGLLERPLVAALKELLEVVETERGTEAYAEFASLLFADGGNLTKSLCECVMEDENTYLLRRAAGDSVPHAIAQAVRDELETLGALCALKSEQVKKCIPDSEYLPDWETEKLDLPALYQMRMKHIGKMGYGIFAKHHMFVVDGDRLLPVRTPDTVTISQLTGYERERARVIENTRALLEGRPANNVLLYGDAGTGKSSTVKAIANEYYTEGLRLIEVKKNQLYQIPKLIESLGANPLKFILFIDDLSFSQNDDNFAALKAILEGSVFACGNHLAVYATSNRRHLIKENFSERVGDEIHQNDALQELRSLSARFGLMVTFESPDKVLYDEIVLAIAKEQGVDQLLSREELLTRAAAYALRAGGRSPRAAGQFIRNLLQQLA